MLHAHGIPYTQYYSLVISLFLPSTFNSEHVIKVNIDFTCEPIRKSDLCEQNLNGINNLKNAIQA